MTTWRQLERGPVVPQVEAMLRERLRSGEWPAGQKIPSEATLASQIEVGRSSVREAVLLLCRDGLLEARHGSGTFVTGAERRVQDVAGLMRRARLLEVYEVRRSLEVEAARLAAHRAPAEALGELRALLEERRSLGDDPARFVAVDLDFHEAVVGLSGNTILSELFTHARPVIENALVDRVTHDGPLIDTADAHDALVDALERRDEVAAIAATVANLEETIRALRAE